MSDTPRGKIVQALATNVGWTDGSGAALREILAVLSAPETVDGVAGVLAEHGLWREDVGHISLGVRCRGDGCESLRFDTDELGAAHQAAAVLAYFTDRP